MASVKKHYPDHLNPFGSEDDSDEEGTRQTTNIKHGEYPDYLSPFGDDDNGGMASIATLDDYDDSLNPFGDEENNDKLKVQNQIEKVPNIVDNNGALDQCAGEGNPFDDEDDDKEVEQQNEVETGPPPPLPSLPPASDATSSISKSFTPQPESLEGPPVPLPRTKSLLKKEQAHKNRQQHQLANDTNQTTSLLSTTSSTSSSSIITTTGINSTTANTNTGSFQRKKNKRNAPPVPINFKRQVSGSLDAIEEELNDIGDKLAILEKESNLTQEELKATYQVDEAKFATTRAKFIELIRQKNSIVRRQKELMYRKRELKLDQIHSDIEYELRMIGNKQLSHRTAEDEIREKELLGKLVEIVEEKSDIVENLNKDTSCDSYDIEEAFRRLNITDKPIEKLPDIKDVKESSGIPIKNENCDKTSLAMRTKLSKIATLLPKSGTLKGTIKIKRKRLFKKCDSRPIER